ncbi:glycoside hydrolase family 9 protein [Marinimicrobium agarilyticum]|uniref:glycoside hydrolase family 9 protein n=1 Tax=Marinimicrobium agarilyticum TaxID=306546 RepID=UPI0004025C04|nr:glycoside hydrolase family 9 protein [Marinimicrobium agarilyticum]
MPNPRFPAILLLAILSGLVACQSELSREQADGPTASIQVNQLGYSPQAVKEATVPAGFGDTFELVEHNGGRTVYRGTLSAAERWPHSGEWVRRADFSDLTQPGHYRLRVPGLADSHPFPVAARAYSSLNDAAIKAYYFNRASTALDEAHAGVYARALGHPDEQVEIHRSAASAERPEGMALASPRGWYDAGDYNKYIVNSGISTYTLLAAYEHFPDYYQGRELNIPESGDVVPDLLNEVMWNLSWMLTMQDPNDGGVYHKLTTKRFSGKVMPENATAQRYFVQKGTAAALNFAAVMATASRVYADYEATFPGFSEISLAAAEAAWEWARSNPQVVYRNPEDIRTGEYGDEEFGDEFAWAAAELYLTTGKPAYWEALEPKVVTISVPNWADTQGLAWLSLAQHRGALPEAAQTLVAERVRSLGDALYNEWRTSAAGVPMRAEDFVWGSNGVAMNSAMMLIAAHRLTDDERYLGAAQSLVDYVLGRNPTGYSYVTGYGAHTPQNIHHRPSAADGIDAPVPGFLAGGPHSGQQDASDCPIPYPSDKPAKSYLDHWCSYASNEITINWNAPLVYVSGALEVLYGED